MGWYCFSFAGRLSGSMKPDRNLGKLRTHLNGFCTTSIMLDYTQYDQLFRHDASLTCEGCEWGYIDTAAQVIVPTVHFCPKISSMMLAL